MARKYEIITELYKRTIEDFYQNHSRWIDFLISAGRNHRLRFDQQVLVFAQRPSATAVLEIDRWNDTFGRWVNRGAVGIAVFSSLSNNQRLTHYFDISDTHETRYSKPVPLWEYNPEYADEIIASLENSFGVLEDTSSITKAVKSAVDNVVMDNIPDYLFDMYPLIAGTIIDEFDSSDKEAIYTNLVENSVALMTLNRLGLYDKELDDYENFQDISLFNSSAAINGIGGAVSDMAELVLTDIQRTILALDNQKRIIAPKIENQYNENRNERSVENGRDNLQHSERIPDTQPDNADTAGGQYRQVRPPENELSEESPQTDISESADRGQPETAPDGHRLSGKSDDRERDGETGESLGYNRTAESDRYDEMGGADGERQTQSGGDSPGGDSLQSQLLTYFPSAEEQISLIEGQAEVSENRASAFSFPQEVIDRVLVKGSGFVEGKYRIYEQFQNNLTTKEFAKFLKNEYGTGGSYPAFYDPTQDVKYNEDHDSKGLHIALSFSKEPGEHIDLSWAKVANRFETLIKTDRYLTPTEKEKYPQWLQDKQQERALAEERLRTYNLLHTPPEERPAEDDSEYEYHLGDRIFLGADEYEILSFDDARVLLYDYRAPLFNKEISRRRFDKEIRKSPLNEHLKAKIISEQLKTSLDIAKQYIDDYCREEFEQEEGADYSDLSKIGVAYTTTEDEEHEVQANINLVDFQIETLVDGNVIRKEQFLSLEELIENGLKNLSFDDLVYLSEEELELVKRLGTLTAPVWEKQKPQRVKSYDLHPDVPFSDRLNFNLRDNPVETVSKRERFNRNVEAIKVLKQCEAESRFATAEEQLILSKYVGWGGIPEAFDSDNSSWTNEYTQLKNLLSDDEYTSARESTLTAFYTPEPVIKAIYDSLRNMGFTGGNILDPATGIGHFIGMLPEDMRDSKVYGVELDKISARIAAQLYQKSTVAQQGYEDTDLPDSFFDIAVGNVPFGNFKLAEKRYDKQNFLIHDYFFAKTLDKLRPGGVMAFITSKGTMDKENPAVRKYIAQRADLLGAIRLPNDTFSGNAGTDVVSDIIFLQKRDRIIDIEPDWVHLSPDESGIPINSYFVDHPEMILGEMKMVSGRFGPEATCEPYEDADLPQLLDEAIQNIHANIEEYIVEQNDVGEEFIPADPTVRNFSYTVVDGEIYFRENSVMVKKELPLTSVNRVKGMINIRDAVRELIEMQTEDYPESDIQAAMNKLNRLYDDFTEKYGLINSRANKSAFNEDSSFSLLSALEVIDEDGKLIRKADMFSKRTIKPHIPVTEVDTSTEALAVSMAEKAKVDMEYMQKLTGKTENEIVADLSGIIFRNPEYDTGKSGEEKYVTADEYLAGNVREKLRAAKQAEEDEPEIYSVNVDALEKAQPKDLTRAEISVRLGATWIPTDDIEHFMYDLLETPYYRQWYVKVSFSKHTGEWNISKKSYDSSNIRARNTYGTERANAYRIIEDTLNLRDTKIYDYVYDDDGKKKPVLNKKETAIAMAKQDLIKSEFQNWIWKDPARRERLTKLYNERFNSIRPREYDGSHITFAGMNPAIEMRQHQKNAVAHILYGGNTLLAHAVGAGKTYEMAAAAMEMKRLGLCSKSLFVVPNHLTEQWASEFLQLYPAANILVATKKDFETKNRKRFCGRIATGDYDAVIIGHSQFEKIPMSIERQERILQEQIKETLDAIAELKGRAGENFSIKQLEKTRKSLETKLKKLNDQSRKDDVVTFEELGVDRIFIDESHYYKNLFLTTKMRNVGGIAQTEAMKSSDLFMKCRYLDEITGGRGTVFATGTPISNSMVELYTIQRYLQYGTLQKYGLQHFDFWASTFGETVTAVELTPEGTGYRAKTRFSRFYNLPELMSMFKEVADIQTADMLELPVPKAEYHNVAVKPSDMQKELVESLAERAERVRNGMVDSKEDNMLKITNDGRKLALDQRMMNEMLPDFEGSKINACVDNIFKIWQDNSDTKAAQLVFCDLSTPKGDKTFSVYNDIRDKLIARGIPAEEIRFIHEADTEAKKKELFAKTRKGDVRVLLGSTQKMGAGTNVQDKLIALHDIDCPWRPADLEQRSGRIIRQGNTNDTVHIYRYVTEQTFDAYLYQLVEGKQKFASQIMTSKSPVRSAEDIDETALSYAEIKMLATGNPHIKEKMDLDIQVQKLRLLKANFLSEKYRLEDAVMKDYPRQIAGLKEQIEGLQADVKTAETNPRSGEDKFVGITLNGVHYSEKEPAGQEIFKACKAMKSPDPVPLGEYRGFDIDLFFAALTRLYTLKVKGKTTFYVELGDNAIGNITRLDNAIDRLPKELEITTQQLENTEKQLENARQDMERPFPQEQELNQKEERLRELNAMLNVGKAENEIIADEPEEDISSGFVVKDYER